MSSSHIACSLTPCPAYIPIQTAHLDSELLLHMTLTQDSGSYVFVKLPTPCCHEYVSWPIQISLLPFIIYCLSFNRYSLDTSYMSDTVLDV